MAADLRGQTISAPWIWLDGAFRTGVRLRLDNDGRIAEINMEKEGAAEKQSESADALVRLPDVAILPGFVNAHSHAFHRHLRGRSQIGGLGADNFWKWRENMYKLVESVDFQQMKQICAHTFREMLSAGITTVGEFHYVHHQQQQEEPADGEGRGRGRFALDMAVAEAAIEVGIRLVLIETLYMRAGFHTDKAAPEQWRFAVQSVDEFVEKVDGIGRELERRSDEFEELVSLGLAVHSLRAVPVPEARRLFQLSLGRALPLHIHLEEQPAELEQCASAHGGRGPSDLLLDEVLLDEVLLDEASEQNKPVSQQGTHWEGGRGEQSPRRALDLFTAVHCTHSSRRSLDRLAARRANICVCPCTEGFLGDGVPQLGADDRLCLGTDCNNRIGMLEEMRWLAFCQNMRTNSRNCAALNARRLLEAATKNGAQSLGLAAKVGQFAEGTFMDFVAVDCRSARLGPAFCQGNPADQLLDAIVFGAGNAEIRMTAVAGRVLFQRD